MAVIKCIHCIEVFIGLPKDDPDKVDGTAWLRVRDADTYVPSWQIKSFAPGQASAACVTVPVCIDHIQVQENNPMEVAMRSGLVLPGQN